MSISTFSISADAPVNSRSIAAYEQVEMIRTLRMTTLGPVTCTQPVTTALARVCPLVSRTVPLRAASVVPAVTPVLVESGNPHRDGAGMQFIELGGPVGGVVVGLGAGAVVVVDALLGLGEAVVTLGLGLADGDPDGLGELLVDVLGATMWHLLAYVPSAATVAGSQITMAPGVAAYGSLSDEAVAIANPDPLMMTPTMTVAQAARSQIRSRPDPLGVAR